jgi:nucleotide-sensitive chloride channel 1A
LPCRRIFWLSAADPALGYSVDFPTISMHAVATDAESFNKPCLYLQLDSGADEEEGGLGQQGASDSGSEDGEEGEGSAAEPLLPELRIIPADAAQRESPRLPACCCFHAVCTCIALLPINACLLADPSRFLLPAFLACSGLSVPGFLRGRGAQPRRQR